MADSLSEVVEDLESWTPSGADPPTLEGAVDPHRSDARRLLFALRPCRGPWIRVPGGAVSACETIGEVRCGPLAFPRVRLQLDGEDPSTMPVLDGLRAIAAGSGGASGAPHSGGLLGGGDEAVGSHDVRVEVHPDGKLYRLRVEVEGHEIRDMDWDSERKVYQAEIPDLPVEDALDVVARAWGNEGASVRLSVLVDGRALEPDLVARVTERPGEARKSYRL